MPTLVEFFFMETLQNILSHVWYIYALGRSRISIFSIALRNSRSSNHDCNILEACGGGQRIAHAGIKGFQEPGI